MGGGISYNVWLSDLCARLSWFCVLCLPAGTQLGDTTDGTSGFGGLVVSILASGTQVHGFKPGRSRQIFWVKKSSACLPSEGK
jgi:hypothetical protein